MEGRKREQGRARKNRHDSHKTTLKKGGKPWKQCQARSSKPKTGNRRYSLYLGMKGGFKDSRTRKKRHRRLRRL